MALLKERCLRDGLGVEDEVLAMQFRLHLHRGIAYWRVTVASGVGALVGQAVAFSETDLTEDLKRFDVPTLILHGDDDQTVRRVHRVPRGEIGAAPPPAAPAGITPP